MIATMAIIRIIQSMCASYEDFMMTGCHGSERARRALDRAQWSVSEPTTRYAAAADRLLGKELDSLELALAAVRTGWFLRQVAGFHVP
jgi:hypothetical protein